MFIGVSAQTLHAAPKNKKSKKLTERMERVERDDLIDVIIKPTASWSAELDRTLSGKGAVKKRSFSNFDFRVFSVKRSEIDSLAARFDIDYLTLDDRVKALGHVTNTTGAAAVRNLNGSSSSLEGSGIGIVIIDSGIDTGHVSLGGRRDNNVLYSLDFTGEGRTDDPYGHGSHVTGLVAGNGVISDGAFEGIAPKANLINLRVLNADGTGSVSSMLAALDWIYTNRNHPVYNIKVVNISLGTEAIDSYRHDPICIAVRKLADAGIVVVAAAGNEGKDENGNKIYGQIHSPGNDPSVITVGAVNTYGTDIRSDDVMTSYSSRGPTRSFYTDVNGVAHYDNLIKPDLTAPGNKLISTQAENNHLVTRNPELYAYSTGSHARKMMRLSGTSMSAPLVAGTAALMLQANPNLTPNMIKMILMYTAQPINGANMFEQGAGQLNTEGAVRLAKLIRPDLSSSTPVGAPLLTTDRFSAASTISGQTFAWGGGVILDHSYATGTDLITKYQGVYDLGVILSDGTVEADGVLVSDATLISDGVLLGDNILVGNGVLVSDGYPFINCGVLMGDGVLLSDGEVISDGVLLGDGVLLSDGVLVSDSVKAGAIADTAYKSMITGDPTASMRP